MSNQLMDMGESSEICELELDPNSSAKDSGMPVTDEIPIPVIESKVKP